MDQNTYLGLMALSEGFGNLSNIGAGRPTQPSQVVPMLIQQRQKEAEKAKYMEALRAAGYGGGAIPSGGLGAAPVGGAPQTGLGVAPGVNPALLAAAGEADPRGLFNMVLEAQLNPKAPPAGPTSVEEFRFAQSQGFQGDYQSFLRQKAEWSRAPGTSVNIRNEGTIPPGYEMIRDEAGRPLRLQPIPGSPDYTAAVSDAGNTIATADQAIATLDALINDPNLPKATGWGSYIPLDIPGFNAETRSRMEQVQGTAFLQAYQNLKGGGQITEVEGLKAEQAIARLKTAQSAPEYQKALREFRDVIEAGRKRAARNLQTTTGRTPPNVPPLNANEMADEELMRALGLE